MASSLRALSRVSSSLYRSNTLSSSISSSSILTSRQTSSTITTSFAIFKMTISRSIQTSSTLSSSPTSTSTSTSTSASEKLGPRHFLSISDLSQSELAALVKRAGDAKAMIKSRKQLAFPLRNGLAKQTIAIMFSKRSTRTRISTEGAVVHLSGHPMFLGKEDIQLGINESILDTSIVISSMTSCIVARVGPHTDILTLAKHSSVPVINALSDSYHPLQAVTDILTIKESFPEHFSNPHGPQGPIKLAWVGDANNVLYDLMTACAKSGIEVAIATPKSYPVDLDELEVARRCADEFGNGARISVTNDPEEAVKNADVIVTDTWISMGQESDKILKLKQFSGYQVTNSLGGGAKPHWKFMHCLPRKPEEVSDEVFYDENRSLVWVEAENRLYAAIAALEAFVVMGGKICPEGVTGGSSNVCEEKELEGSGEA